MLPKCIILVLQNNIAMERKHRRIEGLGDVMKDHQRFEAYPKEIQTAVYKFLTNHRKIRVRYKRKKSLLEESNNQLAIYKKLIESLKKEIKDLEMEETKQFNIAKNLPLQFTISNLFVELDKQIYIKLDIRWCGKKKTLSLGKDLRKVEEIVKKIDPSFNRKINKTNYKFIGASLKKHLDDFLIVNGFERFCGDEKIVWNEGIKDFAYKLSKSKLNEAKDHSEGKNLITKDTKANKSNRIVLDKEFYKKERLKKIVKK
jgi:prefoldin subunit 5